MTLRELINSVDSEQYSDNALYQKLRETKPEYGSSRHIILHELSSNGFSESEESDFWSDFDNLQKAKIVR
jgi:hypothetical protein